MDMQGYIIIASEMIQGSVILCLDKGVGDQ
jgi:hypothetical protein